MRWALNIPLLDHQVYHQIRKKLVDAFGGRFTQVVIGGAPLNAEVEAFFLKIKFPFTVGYGMTECAPLVSFDHYQDFLPSSCGKILDIMEVRIDSSDPYSVAGEIQVRGENVMAGYYRNEEATQNAFTEDGWLKTGDLGTLDKKNNLYIKGRIKTMIVGASGENIYPEEIESVINNFRYVIESLVIEKKGKLVAMVHLNMEEFEKKYRHLKEGMSEKFEEKKQELIEELQEYVNSHVSKFCQINRVVLQPVPFQKTATAKIKRFLYT
jgi:long-chain acyl-CoA synthetase